MAQMYDSAGRKLFGNHVHLDLYPVQYLLGLLAIYLLHFLVPTLLTVVAVIGFILTLLYNLIILRPADYHLDPAFRFPRGLFRAS